jgi:hypothetical protein
MRMYQGTLTLSKIPKPANHMTWLERILRSLILLVVGTFVALVMWAFVSAMFIIF